MQMNPCGKGMCMCAFRKKPSFQWGGGLSYATLSLNEAPKTAESPPKCKSQSEEIEELTATQAQSLKNNRPVFPWILFHQANGLKKLKKPYLKCLSIV